MGSIMSFSGFQQIEDGVVRFDEPRVVGNYDFGLPAFPVVKRGNHACSVYFIKGSCRLVQQQEVGRFE